MRDHLDVLRDHAAVVSQGGVESLAVALRAAVGELDEHRRTVRQFSRAWREAMGGTVTAAPGPSALVELVAAGGVQSLSLEEARDLGNQLLDALGEAAVRAARRRWPGADGYVWTGDRFARSGALTVQLRLAHVFGRATWVVGQDELRLPSAGRPEWLHWLKLHRQAIAQGARR